MPKSSLRSWFKNEDSTGVCVHRLPVVDLEEMEGRWGRTLDMKQPLGESEDRELVLLTPNSMKVMPDQPGHFASVQLTI